MGRFKWKDHDDWKAFDKTLEEGQQEASTRLWSTEKVENFSDWKIIVTLKDFPSTKVTYFVHKVNLCYGPRRSEYFRRLFENLKNDVGGLTQESVDNTTVVEFENKSTIDAFPAFLDFIYTGEYNYNDIDGVSINGADSAVALRYLSNYFVIEELFKEINEFVQLDLSISNGIQYMQEALNYQDEKLVQMVSEYLASETKEMHEIIHKTHLSESTFKKFMLDIPLETFLGPDSTSIISQLAEDYYAAEKTSITINVLLPKKETIHSPSKKRRNV